VPSPDGQTIRFVDIDADRVRLRTAVHGSGRPRSLPARGRLVGFALARAVRAVRPGFPLLGDVLALRGHSLAFPSHPNALVRLVHRTVRPARAGGDFPGCICVRTHPDLISSH